MRNMSDDQKQAFISKCITFKYQYESVKGIVNRQIDSKNTTNSK